MKLSINDEDFPSEKHRNAKIYLNGRRQYSVIEADSDSGVLTRLKTDEKGLVFIDGDELAKETIMGTVRIKL